MSEVVIQVENLGKRYRIGRRPAYGRFSELLTNAGRAGARWAQHQAKRLLTPPGIQSTTENGNGRATDDFWALKDVSFDVKRGEVLGIIGRNGAGKSTLLKILSRITRPTTGEVRLRGRVGSLLEVGTGFHPELSGRENIYLNGAILGMTRAEIKRKFDEIVAFSGVETFLDTPVKHYSSGMYVRLAFAVAAHLEPEVLIVDEVLAVGDAEFQKKCLGKMSEVSKSGRTILFVSHNMAAIQNLCGRAIVLLGGRNVFHDLPEGAINFYLEHGHSDPSSAGCFSIASPQGLIREVRLVNAPLSPTNSFFSGGPFGVEIEYSSSNIPQQPVFGIGIDGLDGYRLVFLQSGLQHGVFERLEAQGIIRCTMPELPLAPGRYLLTVGCSESGERRDLFEHVLEFHVAPADFYGTGRLPKMGQGCLLVEASWSHGPTQCISRC